MENYFHDKVVVIVGATGGLGSSFAQAFANQGARLVLAGRDASTLNMLAEEFQASQTQTVDMTDAASIRTLCDFALAAFGKIDVLVNVTGVDVRKPFEQHTQDDFRRTLDVNLLGAVTLTHEFLPVMRERNNGIIVHIGGFADGRLAFPYYSVNVATRAGLFSFIESINRELQIEQSRVVVSYFSPSAADTPAERPFHLIWREMGIQITPTDKVAAELLSAIEKRERVHIMGGWSTGLFAKLNAIAPKLADVLALNQYGKILNRFFDPRIELPALVRAPNPVVKYGAMGLVGLSFVLYGLIPLVPFAPIATEQKVMVTPVLIGLGEASFWIGGLLLGKQFVAKFKRYLDPRYWLCWKK